MAKTKVQDLSDLDTSVASDKGAEIEIRHPVTNEKTGIFITILGKHSEVFLEHTRHRVNERLRKEAAYERSGKPVEMPTAEEIEESAVELLVLCTIGWRQETVQEGKIVSEASLLYKGEKLPFSIVNAKRIYTDLLFIKKQVDVAIGDLENFMRA